MAGPDHPKSLKITSDYPLEANQILFGGIKVPSHLSKHFSRRQKWPILYHLKINIKVSVPRNFLLFISLHNTGNYRA